MRSRQSTKTARAQLSRERWRVTVTDPDPEARGRGGVLVRCQERTTSEAAARARFASIHADWWPRPGRRYALEVRRVGAARYETVEYRSEPGGAK